MVDESRLLTVPQVAERMQVGAPTVRRWVRQGRLHAIKLGGQKTGYRIRESEVERFLQAGEDRRAS